MPGEEPGTETPWGEFPSQGINAQMCLTQWDQGGSCPAFPRAPAHCSKDLLFWHHCVGTPGPRQRGSSGNTSPSRGGGSGRGSAHHLYASPRPVKSGFSNPV